jgi:acyl-CoA synthetase (AMP-forming)/AMP-acid ligase II
MFFETFQKFGQADALIGEDGAGLSYAELAGEVAARARLLGSGRKLAVLPLRRDFQSIISYFAVLAADHVAILVEPDEAAIAEAVACFSPELVLRGGEIEHRSVRKPGGLPHPELALLMRTSGSTGCAKFVRLSRRNVLSNAESIAAYLGLTSEDRGVLSLPLHYSYGLSILHSHLVRGASLLVSERGVIEPEFLDAVEREKCTNLAGVPYSYEMFERISLRTRALPTLRRMTVAGGKLPPDLVRLYAMFMKARGGKFFAMYGQTEATARIAYLPPEEALLHPGDIGRAVPGGELSLIGDKGEPILDADIVGELVYRGPNVMMGYASARQDLERGHDVAELKTGDLALRTATGFRITGRKSRFSKIGGIRLGHSEVEARLAEQGIAAAIVGDDELVFAALTGRVDEAEALAALKTATGLPRAHLDAALLTDLPLLASGKVDYTFLREMMVRRRAAGRTPEGVHDAFAEAFFPHEVSGKDSFVSLGGDSLAYVRLSIALEKVLGELPEKWEHLPVSDLKPASVRSAARTVETDFALRAFTILTIVVHHATQWPLAGGAAVLLLLAGLNLARFQSANLFAGRIAPMLRTLGRNLLPYFAALVIFALLLGPQPWQVWTLTGNLGLAGYSPIGTPHLVFWFIEAYAHILIGAAVLFSIAPVRRLFAARPFEAGLGLLAAAVAARYATFATWDGDHLRIFTTSATFYVFVFGWCVHFADSKWKKSGLMLLALVLFPIAEQPDFLERTVKIGALILGTAIVLYVPRIVLPRVLVPAVLTIAAASYPIYLFHDIPSVALQLEGVPFGGLGRTLFVIGAGLVLGLLVYFIQKNWLFWRAAERKMGRTAAGKSALRNTVP